MILIDLIYNLSVLVALSVLSGFIDARYDRKHLKGKILQGVLFGGIAIIGMMNPFILTEGIIFDGRSIVISLCTLFFGPLSGFITAVMSIIFRNYLGGAGALMGTLVISASFIIGYYFYYLRQNGKIKTTKIWLYVLGLAVNITMMILMIALPSKYAEEALKVITITVLGFYPLITVIIGKVLSDQEDNKKSIEEIKQSEEKYRTITENSYNLISLIEKDGNFSYCNNSYKEILGYSPNELIGKQCFNLIHPEEKDDIIQLFKKAIEDNIPSSAFQIKIVCSNGEYKLLNHRARVIRNENNEVYKILLIAQDITQQHKAEMELIIAKERAEESDRLKTSFLQNMSHEIRTPLNGILGFAELLNEDNLNAEDVKKYSSIIMTSGNRLLGLINNIIDLSKIESGTISTHKSILSLNKLITDVSNQFLLKLEEKGIKLKIKNDSDNEEIFVESDLLKLHQILTNLLSNAVKFTQKGEIEIGFTINGDEIIFSVRDTGLGIKEEQREKIFERFYQADMSLSRGFEGAGLGLPICQGLVRALNGRIWYESEIQKGSIFYFSISNTVTENKIKGAGKLKAKLKVRDVNVLIAEDDDVSYEFLEMILNKENIKIIRAKNGLEAIEICRKRQDIALILMDIKMPIVNGLKATRIIKDFLPEIPIIAQTAYAFESEKEEAIQTGCNDYLTKPINKDDLLSVISKYIN